MKVIQPVCNCRNLKKITQKLTSLNVSRIGSHEFRFALLSVLEVLFKESVEKLLKTFYTSEQQDKTHSPLSAIAIKTKFEVYGHA